MASVPYRTAFCRCFRYHRSQCISLMVVLLVTFYASFLLYAHITEANRLGDYENDVNYETGKLWKPAFNNSSKIKIPVIKIPSANKVLNKKREIESLRHSIRNNADLDILLSDKERPSDFQTEIHKLEKSRAILQERNAVTQDIQGKLAEITPGGQGVRVLANETRLAPDVKIRYTKSRILEQGRVVEMSSTKGNIIGNSDRRIAESSNNMMISRREGNNLFNNRSGLILGRKVTDGIFWSTDLESYMPAGISAQEADEWLDKSRHLEVKQMQNATWSKCGGRKNAFVVLSGGKEMCARYRDRLHMVFGEAMSYWLSRLMSLDSVAPVALVNVSSAQWSRVTDRQAKLGWRAGGCVAFIMWLSDLERESSGPYIPRPIFMTYRTDNPVTGEFFLSKPSSALRADDSLTSWSKQDIVDTAQWGTMVLFDYITGNYDRVASMQDAAFVEKKPKIILERIRNLRRSKTGKLWLIDNESGMLDAYSLIYTDPQTGSRFHGFHRDMLQTTCVFQRRVVEALRKLHRGSGKPLESFKAYLLAKEPLFNFQKIDEWFRVFEANFEKRLQEVVRWIDECQRKYS